MSEGLIKNIRIHHRGEDGEYLVVHPETNIDSVLGLRSALENAGDEQALKDLIDTKLDKEDSTLKSMKSIFSVLTESNAVLDKGKIIEALDDILIEKPIFIVAPDTVDIENLENDETVKGMLPEYREGFMNGDRVYILSEDNPKSFIRHSEGKWELFSDSSWENVEIDMSGVVGLEEAIQSKQDTLENSELLSSIEGSKEAYNLDDFSSKEEVSTLESNLEEVKGDLNELQNKEFLHVGSEVPSDNQPIWFKIID